MRRNSLALSYAKHKNRTRKKDLTKPEEINRLWETDIHYVSTQKYGMNYLMSIKDCFSKKWISYEFSRICTATDCIRAVEKAFSIRFPDGIRDIQKYSEDSWNKITIHTEAHSRG